MADSMDRARSAQWLHSRRLKVKIGDLVFADLAFQPRADRYPRVVPRLLAPQNQRVEPGHMSAEPADRPDAVSG